ncbi:uncharacterized protein LOC144647098 [Oculina patagonica]
MNTLVVWLVFLMATASSVSEFTDFEDGVVRGIVQHKESEKCLKFGVLSHYPSGTCKASNRGPFRQCSEDLAFLATSGCATVILDTSGLIKVAGECVHWFQYRDVFRAPCGRWPGDFAHHENLVYAFVQSNGQILLSSKQTLFKYCLTKHTGYDPKLRALSTSDPACQASASRFRLVDTGMSWYASDSSTVASGVNTRANHCDYSNRRLCTTAEVCPTSPGGQSVVGVTGESSNKALLVEGGTFLDSATCQGLLQTSGYNVDGFLCCPSDDLPSPKDFVSDVNDCRKAALGMESGAILDSQISASSKFDSNHAAIQGRLNFKVTGAKEGGWCARANDVYQWLQVDLIGQYTRVARVATQGRNAVNQWVTMYKLQYSNDAVNFQYYREQGQTVDKVFAGNKDQDTVVSHDLNPPIRARFIRFRPVAWYGHISMRVELYDCPQGYGYFMHKSGKCAHYINQTLVLKTDCKSQTALLSWSSDGTIKQGANCIVNQSLGQCPPFQFTNVNSLQDVFTSKCLVPKAGQLNPAEDTELVERAECGEAYASFALKRIKGYLKHSSNKCVGVKANKLVFQASCTSAEQVFYKESYYSPLVHVASEKCVADPGSDDTALTLTDCTSTGSVATLSYDGTTLEYSGDKCVKPQGGGDSPANDEELVIQTGCSGASSTFHFADATFSECQSCMCIEGYEKRGEHCFPINNCDTSNGGCQGNAECVHTGPGTSMCVCPPGYNLNADGTNCEQCTDNNCYTQCQFVDDNELRRVTRLKTHVEIRFLNIKTSDLRHYIGDTTTELVVYAHQLTISGTLTLPSGLAKVAFFANEILKENGGEIVLWNNAHDTTPTAGRRAVVKVEDEKLLCQNRYSGPSPWPGYVQGTVLNIYTSKSSVPFTCSGNYNGRDISIQAAIKSKRNPKKSMDVKLYSMMLNCAKVVAQGNTFAKDGKLLRGSLPVALTQKVLDEVRVAREEGLDTSSVDALRLVAKNMMEDLSLRARGFYKVPYLSLKAHEKILVLIKDDAKMAIQKYERFERISQDFEAGIEATDSMTELMTAIVRKNDLDIEALETELEAAKADSQAMKEKLDDAITALDDAKEVFDAGVRDYSNQQIANAVFSVIGGIASVFGGGGGAVVGLAIELSSLAEDVNRVKRALFKISIIMDSIASINEAAITLTDFRYDVFPYAGTSTSDYYSKSRPEKNDQSLAVMVKEWDVFEAEADAFLGVGTASGISGASVYLAALKTVAVWGKGYHEKSITVQELLARLTTLKILKNEQHQAQAKIKESRETALTEQISNGELLLEMALQKQRLRNIMVEKLMSFCDSYFYNWLSECPVMPTISDDLYALHDKVNQGLSAAINAVANFAPFIPQEFEATIVITDEQECSARRKRALIAQRRHQLGKRSSGGANQLPPLNTLKCPISELKRTNSFLFKLDENDPDIFMGHERVHVDEFEIYFEGAEFGREETKKSITAWISFTGMMTDVFRGARYEFLAPPRVTEFSYKIKQHGSYEVTQSGKVSNKFQEYYDGIAALTTWSVNLPDSLNRPSLNLADVTRVKLKLKGTRVPVQPVEDGNEKVGRGDKGSGQDRKVAKNDEAKRQKGKKGRKIWKSS